MAQTFGILGFMLSLLALFFASEVMRRASHRQTELETALFKATTRIQKLESGVHHVEKLAAEIRHQRKRQAETINALAQKGASKKGDANKATPHAEGTGEQFTPTSHSHRTTRKTG